MIVRTVLSTKRPAGAIAVVLVLSSACTSMLGIDGDYSARPITASDTGPASGGKDTGAGAARSIPEPTGAGGAARFDAGTTRGGGGTSGGGTGAIGDTPIGGAPVGGGGGGSGSDTGGSGSGSGGASGGTPSSGGHPSNGGSAGAGTGGGIAPDLDAAVPVCPTGTYTGTYRGTHKPGTLVSVLNAPIAGDVTLRFSAIEGTSAITGTLIDPLADTTGGVAGTLRGTLDCVKGTGSATLSTAEVTTLVPLVYVAVVEGSIDIKIGQTGAVNGTFAIHETSNSMGAGSGTWSAAR